MREVVPQLIPSWLRSEPYAYSPYAFADICAVGGSFIRLSYKHVAPIGAKQNTQLTYLSHD